MSHGVSEAREPRQGRFFDDGLGEAGHACSPVPFGDIPGFVLTALGLVVPFAALALGLRRGRERRRS